MTTPKTAYARHKQLIRELTTALEETLTQAKAEGLHLFTPALEDLIGEAHEAITRKKGSGRKASHGVTDREFRAATHGDGRGSGHKLTVKIRLPSRANNRTMVDWTCPNCGTLNSQLWYGRAAHVCKSCDLSTDIKGEQK